MTMIWRSIGFLAMGLLALSGVSCSGGGDGTKADSAATSRQGDATSLEGAGATFPEPLYTRWFQTYSQAHPGVQINYQAVGSGGGIKAIIDRTADFGASDAAMTPDEMKKVDVGVQLIPMTAGSIVLAYNLEGVNELKLSPEAYAGIFLGKVTKWNDPLIAKTNAGVQLPAGDINVVVRADSSGTTFVFTKHLSAVSPDFANTVGANKRVDWPVGTQSKGNDGVAASIKATQGSIGYMEYGYAQGSKLAMAKLQNKAGKFVEPTQASGRAALASAELPKDLIVWVSNPEGEDSYPIVTFTWIICYKTYANAQKVKLLKDALTYGLTEGQEFSGEMGYIPLPEAVVAKAKAALDNIQAAGAGGKE
jgi:phosphate transport system substrate-binding protein